MEVSVNVGYFGPHISSEKNLIKDSSLNSNIEFLLDEIKIVNSSINEVGISISKIAKSLYEIKKFIKNNYWVKKI